MELIEVKKINTKKIKAHVQTLTVKGSELKGCFKSAEKMLTEKRSYKYYVVHSGAKRLFGLGEKRAEVLFMYN